MSDQFKAQLAERIAKMIVGLLFIVIYYVGFRYLFDVSYDVSLVGAFIISMLSQGQLDTDEKIEALTQEMMR